jgi:hypothetical protein
MKGKKVFLCKLNSVVVHSNCVGSRLHRSNVYSIAQERCGADADAPTTIAATTLQSISTRRNVGNVANSPNAIWYADVCNANAK